MRLIDADSLYRKGLNEYIYEYGGDEYHFDETRFSILIESEPTVDAVPVEFIEKRIAELDGAIDYEFNKLGNYNGWALHAQSALEQLLKAWEAERREE